MPMPPEAAAPPAPEQEEASEGGENPKELIIGVHTGLAKVVQLVSKAGAPEEVVAELQGALDAYRSAMEKLMGGGGKPSPADAGSASPEQGGNKNAVPMG